MSLLGWSLFLVSSSPKSDSTPHDYSTSALVWTAIKAFWLMVAWPFCSSSISNLSFMMFPTNLTVFLLLLRYSNNLHIPASTVPLKSIMLSFLFLNNGSVCILRKGHDDLYIMILHQHVRSFWLKGTIAHYI